ncbi:hypothetical protein MC885_012108, partial [Smutsia gigantea]
MAGHQVANCSPFSFMPGLTRWRAELLSREEKLGYLKRAYKASIKNIEMASTVFVALKVSTPCHVCLSRLRLKLWVADFSLPTALFRVTALACSVSSCCRTPWRVNYPTHRQNPVHTDAARLPSFTTMSHHPPHSSRARKSSIIPGKTLKDGNSFIPCGLTESEPGQVEEARGLSPGRRPAGHRHVAAGNARDNGVSLVTVNHIQGLTVPLFSAPGLHDTTSLGVSELLQVADIKRTKDFDSDSAAHSNETPPQTLHPRVPPSELWHLDLGGEGPPPSMASAIQTGSRVGDTSSRGSDIHSMLTEQLHELQRGLRSELKESRGRKDKRKAERQGEKELLDQMVSTQEEHVTIPPEISERSF